MKQIIYKPIGFIHSPFKKPENMPIQPTAAKDVKGYVELEEKYMAGLKDLAGFSHIYLIYHLHLSKGYKLAVIPFLDKISRGLFATRAPRRPNAIGISIVKLRSIKKNILHIENVDIVDGTPLLDIKPYIPQFEPEDEVEIGWLKNVKSKLKKVKSDRRFS